MDSFRHIGQNSSKKRDILNPGLQFALHDFQHFTVKANQLLFKQSLIAAF